MPNSISNNPEENYDESILSMSYLGAFGRFGNQIFQYAFLRICAKNSNSKIECPTWIGQKIFGHKDHPLSSCLAPAIEKNDGCDLLFDKFPNFVYYLEKKSGHKSIRIDQLAMQSDLKNVDIFGHFQFHTQVFKPYKEYFYSLFQPVEALKAPLESSFKHAFPKGKTIVGIHIRQGDYVNEPLWGCGLIFPTKWYRQWLEKVWSELEDPILFLCSDNLDGIIAEFDCFSPITLNNLNVDIPQEFVGIDLDFYIDFFMMSKCDIVCTSNSTFSFAACMLNERGYKFLRPSWDFSKKFIEFDPWDAKPLLWLGYDQPKLFKNLTDIIYFSYRNGGISAVFKSCFLYLPKSCLFWINLNLFWARKSQRMTWLDSAIFFALRGIRKIARVVKIP
ncbi:alpha-1,2-fucosyltransferase [filamentous cyanobacterium LEGE 11480]|uniref:Alpha-1,2-fucosyltransferase n=1 Tax=Romeriopsis navalis LEGE 11480 TaxID=2777977 RepID=A0A928VK04_9CYAN|nr:alpha-1,2-fucosyltransferase [Romeriopsis navalis]MBE9029052.1 alpha-1,2-fucosyltransferase [Romeriopsis navalis LEGE 11480]